MTTQSTDNDGLPPVEQDPKISPDFIQFKCMPPGEQLNRWSTNLTRGHDFPGAQVRLCHHASAHITLFQCNGGTASPTRLHFTGRRMMIILGDMQYD
jgi:hypothetical protein